MSPDTVDALAWYNFSGRNQQEETGAELLAAVIGDLLRDPEQRERLGTFGRKFVCREIDAAHGAQRIREIYHRMIAVEAQLPRWRQALSLAACLVPIVRDNSLHPAREWVKKLLYH
jgi:hypothetical protein